MGETTARQCDAGSPDASFPSRDKVLCWLCCSCCSRFGCWCSGRFGGPLSGAYGSPPARQHSALALRAPNINWHGWVVVRAYHMFSAYRSSAAISSSNPRCSDVWTLFRTLSSLFCNHHQGMGWDGMGWGWGPTVRNNVFAASTALYAVAPFAPTADCTIAKLKFPGCRMRRRRSYVCGEVFLIHQEHRRARSGTTLAYQSM